LTPPTGNIIFKISDSLKSCKVKVNRQQVEFNALTCIDKASKLVHTNLKTIHYVLRALVHANLKTIHYVLRTLVHANPACNMTQARDIINEALATAMHAMQATIVTTVGSSPGSLAFA
jgi:hypothetical protein